MKGFPHTAAGGTFTMIPVRDPMPEPRTIRMTLTVYLPETCRVPTHQLGNEARHLAGLLTTHLNENYLPAITSGAHPVALAVVKEKGGAE